MSKKVLKFSATWCNPCKQLAKSFELIETDVEVISIDVDENPEAASRYRVRGIPTLVLLDGDQEIARNTGALSPSELLDFLKQ
jgi:thioredoxin 1